MSSAQNNADRPESTLRVKSQGSDAYVWQKARARAVRETAISVSHHCAACVLDEKSRILTFSKKFPLIIDQGFIQKIDLERLKPRLILSRTADQKLFAPLMQHIIDGEAISEGALFIGNEWIWRVVVQELDPDGHSAQTAIGAKRQFIVRFINLALKTSVRPFLSILQDVFALTPAELNLCAELLEARTLPEASERLGVKVSTARTQLKSIFEKVGVNSQTALIAKLTALIIRSECANAV